MKKCMIVFMLCFINVSGALAQDDNKDMVVVESLWFQLNEKGKRDKILMSSRIVLYGNQKGSIFRGDAFGYGERLEIHPKVSANGKVVTARIRYSYTTAGDASAMIAFTIKPSKSLLPVRIDFVGAGVGMVKGNAAVPDGGCIYIMRFHQNGDKMLMVINPRVIGK